MSKRQTSNSSEDVPNGCKWTAVEQSRLKDLLEKGKIGLNESASKIKEKELAFSQFSNSVVGYHLGVLRKEKLKSDCNRRTRQTGVIPSVNEVLSDLRIIPNNATSSVLNVSTAEEPTECPDVVHTNMPFLRYNYMKYDSKQEKVVVMLDLPGGTGDYDWEFNDYGDSIIIVGNWSKALYDVQNLYKKNLEDKLVSLDHPKLHAMQNEVMRQGFSSKNVPKFRIQVDLGKRVHKDDGTWKVEIVQHEGNKVLLFEFSGFQEDILKIEKRGKFT